MTSYFWKCRYNTHNINLKVVNCYLMSFTGPVALQGEVGFQQLVDKPHSTAIFVIFMQLVIRADGRIAF